jgi:hypothetical protein
VNTSACSSGDFFLIGPNDNDPPRVKRLTFQFIIVVNIPLIVSLPLRKSSAVSKSLDLHVSQPYRKIISQIVQINANYGVDFGYRKRVCGFTKAQFSIWLSFLPAIAPRRHNCSISFLHFDRTTARDNLITLT